MTEARMQETTEHAPGTFCWVDLGTTDPTAAKTFYTGLFGWTAFDVPAGPDGTYTMLQLDGKEVAALYKLNEQQTSMGVPPHWLSYISVTSADETTTRAKELGASVILEPFDVMDVGRMSIITDPTGATFALWEARTHKGARLVGQPNTLCWNELMTTDTAKAREFYTNLFAWAADTMPMGEMEYTIFRAGEKQAGGCMAITPEMGPVPPNWSVYFAVDDCDAKAAAASALGASTLVPPTDIPGIGRFAGFFDPQGAAFAIISLG